MATQAARKIILIFQICLGLAFLSLSYGQVSSNIILRTSGFIRESLLNKQVVWL